jgi:peptide/nickel transport system substrate-binding protein
MKKLRWQLLIIFLTGLVVGILLLGEQPKASLPSDTPAPTKGGVYTEALVGSFQRLNPILSVNNPPDNDISRLIFSGLIHFDGRGTPQPELAEKWGVSEDGTVYNFALREKLQWHDGKPLTTDDVVFTINLIKLGGKAVPKDLQEFWKSVDVVKLSETAIQFRLPEAYAPFMDFTSFGILPKHLLEGKTVDQIIEDPFNLQPVGSGPFKFSRLIVENGQVKGVVLAAFSNYALQKPYLDEVVFRYFPDSQSALKAYRDGQVQGIGNVDTNILEEVLSEPNLEVYSTRQPKTTFVLFNLKNPNTVFLQDKKIRKALLESINRQGIIDQKLQGQAIMADGPIFPGTWAYYENAHLAGFDREDAKLILKQAGYTLANDTDTTLSKNGAFLKFTLLAPDQPIYQGIAEMIQASWREIGVEVDIESLPYDQLVGERLADRNYDAALVDLNLARSPDPDPYPFWDQAQASANGQNYTQWDNRMASEYLEQARITTNMADRARYYRNFQVVFNEEIPAIPLFYGIYSYAVDKEIQGVRVGPLFDASDRFSNINEWYLAGRPKGQTVPTVTKLP